MNIKSLILGSATAALAVTGAQAADAIIIAEPEPVEYVRVCDVYGAGYFYIPGTETCLRISGWVRHQMETTDRGWKASISGPTFNGSTSGDGNINLVSGAFSDKDRGLNHGTGAQINLDARSETEYGTLRGWVQLEGFQYNQNQATPDVDIRINRAMIQLGGLYMGYADSLFSSSSNIGGSGLGNYAGFTYADTFPYHYEQRHQIGYQFSGGNGFWGAISIEHDTDTNNYTPDVVGKVAFQQAWGGAWLSAAYDESARGFGVRGGVQGNFGALTGRLDAYYQNKAEVAYGRDARWALQGTALYQINPQFGIAAGLEYRKDLALGRAFYIPGSDAWGAQVGINWQPVQNFQIGADVTFNKEKAKFDVGSHTVNLSQDNTRFRLRFQRNF